MNMNFKSSSKRSRNTLSTNDLSTDLTRSVSDVQFLTPTSRNLEATSRSGNVQSRPSNRTQVS